LDPMKAVSHAMWGLLSVAAIACATPVPRYQPPRSASTALLLSAADLDSESGLFGSGTITVHAFEPETCAPSKHGLRLIAFPDGPPDQASGVRSNYSELVAEEPIVLTFMRQTSGGLGRSGCAYSIEFTPRAGATYKATYEAAQGWCRVKVLSQAPDSSWNEVPVSPSPVCLDDESKRRFVNDYGGQ